MAGKTWIFSFFILSIFHGTFAMFEGLYCGKRDCYEVLGLTRIATKNEISKSYRQLARKYHPDMHKVEKDKEVAVEMFRVIANAYEILKDEESRADYDYMLDHPEEVYSHYYRYYRRRIGPRVDVRLVIIVVFTIVSAVQYYAAWQRYHSAISYLLTVPKYRNRALEYAKMEGLVNENKKIRGKSKTETKEETEAAIKRVLEDNMDIRGGYAKPKIVDVLLVKLLILPYTLLLYISWQMAWFYKYKILRKEYGVDEKYYLIRKNMNINENQFDDYTEQQKKEFLKNELWIKDKCKKWQEQKEEEHKRQMAENPRYKAYRRYIRNHGVSRLTFDDS